MRVAPMHDMYAIEDDNGRLVFAPFKSEEDAEFIASLLVEGRLLMAGSDNDGKAHSEDTDAVHQHAGE